jgi:hypothetical protein
MNPNLTEDSTYTKDNNLYNKKVVIWPQKILAKRLRGGGDPVSKLQEKGRISSKWLEFARIKEVL